MEDKQPDMNGIELNEAADILGTSPEAIRKRIQRGSLTGYKVDNRWYVVLPDEELARAKHSESMGDDDVRTRPDESTTVAKAYESMITSMQEEINFLRQQLSARTDENLRKDHIIAGLASRLPELPEVTNSTSEARFEEELQRLRQEITATEQARDERARLRDEELVAHMKQMLETRRAEEPQSWWKRLWAK